MEIWNRPLSIYCNTRLVTNATRFRFKSAGRSARIRSALIECGQCRIMDFVDVEKPGAEWM